MPEETENGSPTQASTPKYDSSQNLKPPSITKKIIVIAVPLIILALAISLVLYFVNSTKITKGDSQRKTDVQQLAGAFENFRQKTQNQSYYPGAVTKVTMIDSGILTTIPEDPVGTEPYTYHHFRSPEGCVANCTGFSITACLQNPRDPQKDSTTNPVCPIASYSVVNK